VRWTDLAAPTTHRAHSLRVATPSEDAAAGQTQEVRLLIDPSLLPED
jgi:hypothetical protein